jgi:hypothetical protein
LQKSALQERFFHVKQVLLWCQQCYKTFFIAVIISKSFRSYAMLERNEICHNAIVRGEALTKLGNIKIMAKNTLTYWYIESVTKKNSFY